MATKRGKVTDRLAVVVGPAAEVSIIYGLGKSATEKLARAEYSRLYKIDQAVHRIVRSGKTAYECVLSISRSAKGEDDGKHDAPVNPKAAIVDKPGKKMGPELRPMVKITPGMLPSTVR